jgi:hypothetical protein
METVLRNILPESSGLLVVFYGQKDPMKRIFRKKYFLFTVGGTGCVKRFTTGSRNILEDVRKSQMLPDQVRKSVETRVTRFLCCGFRRSGKAMGQVLVEDMSRIKCFFQVRISHFLRFISICDLSTDSRVRYAPCSVIYTEVPKVMG